MKRLLARPPKLTLKTSFAEAYRSGRFTQLELIDDRELIREAKKHDLTINQATLEDLDRHGAFTPVAFVGADWRGDFYGPRWNLDAMTFRDEVGFQRWSHYRFREDGFPRVIALYSPWQLLYLKSALEDRRSEALADRRGVRVRSTRCCGAGGVPPLIRRRRAAVRGDVGPQRVDDALARPGVGRRLRRRVVVGSSTRRT